MICAENSHAAQQRRQSDTASAGASASSSSSPKRAPPAASACCRVSSCAACAQGDAAGLIAGHQLRQLGVVQIGNAISTRLPRSCAAQGCNQGKPGQQGFKVPALDADSSWRLPVCKRKSVRSEFCARQHIFLKNNGLNFCGVDLSGMAHLARL